MGVVCPLFFFAEGCAPGILERRLQEPCKHVLRHGGNHKEIDLLVAVWTMSGGPLERSRGA